MYFFEIDDQVDSWFVIWKNATGNKTYASYNGDLNAFQYIIINFFLLKRYLKYAIKVKC